MKRHDRYFVYILQCRTGTYYTGYTNNLEKRVALHNKGRGAKYLRGKLPAALVYFKKFAYYKNALKEEKRVKKLPRKKKEELINGETDLKRQRRNKKINPIKNRKTIKS